MDTAILSATAALVGSLIGGVSTFTASWATQRWQLRSQSIAQHALKRETLYADFIIEASERYAHAWGHEAESPEVLASFYSAVERMRLMSSITVIAAAEHVICDIAEAYAHSNETFDQVRGRLNGADRRNPLRSFTETCRQELLGPGG